MRGDKVTMVGKGILRLVDVSGWQKWFGAAVLGFAFALSSLNGSFSLVQVQGLVLGMPMILCYIQAVNDCFDVEIDTVKEKLTGKQLIVTKVISSRTAFLVTFSALLIGLFSAWMGSLSLLLIACVMALFGTLYSAPPFRLKMIYPFSTLIQFAGCFLPFLAGIAVIGNVTAQAVVISSVFALLAMIHRFDHEIENYRTDLQTKKNTVAVVKGLKATVRLRRLSIFIGAAELVAFFILGWLNVVLFFLFALYVPLIVVPSLWLRYVPQPLKSKLAHLLMMSGFILLVVVLILFNRELQLTLFPHS
ncbi:MAG: UbiA family prenyltransferase [Candidatus Bathyarchaeia archaeon]